MKSLSMASIWWHNVVEQCQQTVMNIDEYCSTNTNDNSRRGNKSRETEHNWNKSVKTNKIYNKSNNLHFCGFHLVPVVEYGHSIRVELSWLSIYMDSVQQNK